MSKPSKLVVSLVVCTFLSGASALAAPISIFGTGVSVTDGVDEHYTITAGPTANPVVSGLQLRWWSQRD
jgi:hypothetical protein